MDNNYQSLQEALVSEKKINKQLSARIRKLERIEDELKKKSGTRILCLHCFS